LKDCVAVGVGNGRSAGGGIKAWPEADATDGALDVCAVAVPNIAKALRVAAKARSGRHVEDPGVYISRGSVIEVEADPQLEFNVDGELAGLKTPARFLVAGKIKIRVPG
jgi:diacylglycerol kinase (ATP)